MGEESLKPPPHEDSDPDQSGFLKSGQNFFDQEPFRTPIVKVTEEGRIDVNKIRRILRRLAKGLVSLEGEKGRILNVEESKEYLASFIRIPLDTENVRRGHRIPYLDALSAIFDQLAPYPSWYQYIGTVMDDHYRFDGTPKAQALSPFKPEDYPYNYSHWIVRQKASQENSVLLGIDQVFQNVSYNTPNRAHKRARTNTTRAIPLPQR